MHTPELAPAVDNAPTSTTTTGEEVVFIDAPDREPTPNELRVQGKLQALAALAALGAMSHGEAKELRQSTSTAPRRPQANISAFGICVGRDSGRDPHAEQPRNQPCKCGSGKKAKKCCNFATKLKKFEAKKREGKYKYIGSDDPSLIGETALGTWYAGQLKVQVDNTNHPWAFGWHMSKASDWERID